MSSGSTHNVFLSSTGRDLSRFRDAVYAVIESLEGYHCVRMEDFTSQTDTPLNYLRERLSTCDLMISVVGLCYGSSPPGSDVSYTEHEYKIAKKAGISCFVFLIPNDFPIPANILIEDKNWEKQQNFRREVREDVVTEMFQTPDELAVQVIAAIRNWEHRPSNKKPGALEPIDCVILCGGHARRLWPLTLDISKMTLPVAGHPILSYVIDFASKSPFIRQIFLSVNAKYADQLAPFKIQAYSTSKGIPVEMIVEPESGPQGKFGPLGALDYVVSKTGGARDLVVLGGDNLFGFGLEDFQQFAAGCDRSVNALFRFPLQEDTSEYGVASLNSDGLFAAFQEKCSIPSFKDVSAACYLFRSNDIERLHTYLSYGQYPDSLGNFLHWLTIGGNPPIGYCFSSSWFDIGTRDKLLAANKYLMSDSRRGAQVNSVIKGPVMFHDTSSVENSVVGPYVWLSQDTQIVDSEVLNSVIMEGAIIRHAHLHDSIIGPGSVVEGNHSDLVCGPNSKISF